MATNPPPVESALFPTRLHVRVSSKDSRAFEVVTESGEVLAAEVPDLNCAEVFAAAPLLMEGLNIAIWKLKFCTLATASVDGTRLSSLLECFDELEEPMRVLDKLLPIGRVSRFEPPCA